MNALFLVVVAWIAGSGPSGPPAQAGTPPTLDYEFFKARVQPIFLNKRKGLARCYSCHSQGTPFVLQRLAAGEKTWGDEASRKNFAAASRLVNPANPEATLLLRMPLAAEAGGVRFHPGGKHWTSKDDPEWQTMAAWVRGGK